MNWKKVRRYMMIMSMLGFLINIYALTLPFGIIYVFNVISAAICILIFRDWKGMKV